METQSVRTVHDLRQAGGTRQQASGETTTEVASGQDASVRRQTLADQPTSNSRASTLNEVAPEPILLEDYSQQPDERQWATDAGVTRYEIISGSYVMWTLQIATVRGPVVSVYRRYSEFYELWEQLILKFPLRQCEIPDLPPKTVISKFDAQFLAERRRGLDYFLKCVVLNRVIGNSSLVKRFCSKQR